MTLINCEKGIYAYSFKNQILHKLCSSGICGKVICKGIHYCSGSYSINDLSAAQWCMILFLFVLVDWWSALQHFDSCWLGDRKGIWPVI